MTLKIDLNWPANSPQASIPIDCRNMKVVDDGRATKDCSDIEVCCAFGSANRVNDDDVYRITSTSESPLSRCAEGAPYSQTLVIVLESPHKYEYRNYSIDQPIAPAQGSTGRCIRDYLMSVIRGCNHLFDRIDQQTRVLLSNPIQFQCSLISVIETPGKAKGWQMIRDEVWMALWNRQEIRREFGERLASYGPDFIINACTESGAGDRKDKITDFLAIKCPDAELYRTSHPSNWFSPFRPPLVHIE